MIRFAAPEWWMLAPLLLIVGFTWRRLKLWQPLRLLCLLLLLLILTQLQVRRLGRGLDLWVLVDRSASAADAMSAHLGEWQTLLERSKGPDDRLVYVDYAESPVVRGEGTEANPSELQSTHTRLAIRHALSQMVPARAARLLTLTDGFSTEPLADISDRLLEQGVPLDYRLVTPPNATDYGVDCLRLPPRAQPGEPFLVEMDVSGTPDATVPFEVLRDDQRLHTGTIEVRNGRGTTRFADRLTAGGAHRYTLRLNAPGDTRAGNNSAEGWIEITGRPHILLVTDYVNDPVADALRTQGFEVRTVNDLSALNVGDLSGARAVILNNVPAYKLPSDFLNSLDLYVRAQGGGLVIAGGKYAFGSGGYAHSAVDDLLPVSMELRTEHRKLAVAMAIVMDRSGSMSAGVAGGVTKMDLADEGAARAIDLLGAQDAASVIAVDTEPHVIVPLTKLGNDRKELTNTVRRIVSEGGGIYIFNGLKGGWEELQKATAGQRHLLLFADASDSVQPQGYEALIDEMVKAGVTISVIGMGSESDKDADLLKDIAARGKGQVFFDADPATLPALFEQETVAMARSAFLDEPVGVKPAAGWLELAAKPLAWPAAVDGYNLSYLKPDATAAAYSADEYAAPLLAFWQRGLGRTAAVSFPLGGDYSARVRAWPQYGDLLQTLTRWLMGDELPPGLALRPHVDGTDLQLDLFYDQTWEERLAASAPGIVLADGATGQPRPVVWEHLEPGHFRAVTTLPPGQWVRGAVQLGRYAVPFGPIAAGINPEWTFDHARITELQNVARLSGGGERTDLSKIWEAPRKAEFRELRTPLLLMFLLAFLADALATRLGWRLPGLRRTVTRRFGRSPGVHPSRNAIPVAGPSEPVPIPAAPRPVPSPSPQPSDHAAVRASRFRQAKAGRTDDEKR